MDSNILEADEHDRLICEASVQAAIFQGVVSRLEYIRDLGVNVIYLLPTYPVGTLNSFNSPCCVKDYMGVNPEFGSLYDLRNLVDEAHARGMSVIFDWVANHSS